MRTDQTHLDLVASHESVRMLARALAEGKRVGAFGSAGSSAALVAGAVARLAARPVLVVTAHLDDADEAVDELSALGVDAARLPALELLPGESAVSLELFAERLAVVRRVLTDGPPAVLLCPIQSLMQAVPAPGRLDALSLVLRPGDGRGLTALTRWLDQAGYRRCDSIEEPGDFAVRGGILDVFPPGAASEKSAPAAGAESGGAAIRLDFFGDELESIHEIDLETMGSDRRLESAEIVGARLEAVASDEHTVSFLDLLPRNTLAMLIETLETTEQARGYYERVTDSRGVFGPPAVFRLMRERFPGFAELNQFSAAAPDIAVRVELPARPLPEFARDAGEAVAELAAMTADHRVRVLCQNEGERSRLGELLAEFGGERGPLVEHDGSYLHRGFLWGPEERPLALVPYHELLHRYQSRRRIRRLKAGRGADTFLELTVGDFVVHSDHGIARFTGLKTMRPHGPKPTAEQHAADLLRNKPAPLRPGKADRKGPRTTAAPADGQPGEGADPQGEEYMTLEFAAGARLHVPVSQIDRVQKYVGGHGGAPPLSPLGGKRWQSQKQAVKESVRDLAAEMLRIQAAREHMPGIRFPADTPWQKEFEAEFPYEETEDQLAAIAELKRDMTRERPMDRLLCGDVGYGKTEVAIRAAFKAVEFGKQVAVLVPTTLLAEQHERTFRARFADYPFRVASVSRFKTGKECNEILAATRKGQVDILIGTHRLLSKDVRFADLGLVIIDEEQRFGVEHKQALLGFRMTADVLTLSATPIPRTLHMSMLGLRDISSLTTPPMDRRSVVTEVIPYNERRIAAAIARELNRDGQVYFVHNRVHNIRSVADDVQRLAPGARIVIGHGQMPDDELEDVMRRFIGREADILVSTTIIESGIDIPTANTMFINNADHFGLADLHQLRGRVGRYKHRAYCYLLLPSDRPVTDSATRRLRAIEEFSMLGAGFKIAMRDLEIRGAGNLLGAEQSGHIAAVGYDMYCRLLEQAARELRSEPSAQPSETTIDIGATGQLPKVYIPSDTRRLEAYRRIVSAATPEQLAAVVADLSQAYGQPPKPAQRLLELAELRIGAHARGVRSIAVHEQDVILRCDPAAVSAVAAALEGVKGTVRPLSPKPGEKLAEVYFRPPPNFLNPESLLTILRRRFAAPSVMAQPHGALT
ncbi:MAG: transcription-repair coupling factor [Phycisphaerales bacterium]|nr:transcription-repair coupling factor [Phycisphaerales bacterium]